MTDFLFSQAEPVQGSVIDVLQIGSYDSTRYGKFEITRDDFDAYIREFKDSNASGRRQVDFDHKGSQGDTRAAGWIQDLHVDGDKLKATVEWTPAGKAAVEGKEYRFTSAEYQTSVRSKKTGKTEGRKVLKAVTLTNRPFIDTMDPVSLNEDPSARLAVVSDPGEDELLLSTGTIGGTKNSKLPKSSYAWVDGNGVGHLPYRDSSGNVDAAHVRNALSRLNQVKGMPDDAREAAKGKLQAALESVGGDPSDDNDKKTRKHMSEIHTLLGLSEDAEDAALLSAVQTLIEKAKEPAEDTVSLAEFQTLAATSAATAKAFTDFQRDTYLSEMSRSGKLTPAEITEGSIIKLYDAAPEACRAMIEARPVNVKLGEIGSTEANATGETKLSEEAVYGLNGRQALHKRTLVLAEEKNIPYGEAMLLAAQEAGV